MALTLLRHGPVHPRYQRRYNGWTDLPLERTLFEPHKLRELQTIPFDAVYCSDLRRCTETLDALGIADYTTDARLREVRFKAHIEGKNFNDVSKQKDFSSELLNDERAWHAYVCAESYERFSQRIQHFLDETTWHDKEVLVCTHGGVIHKIYTLLSLPYVQPLSYGEYIRIER